LQAAGKVGQKKQDDHSEKHSSCFFTSIFYKLYTWTKWTW